MSRGEECSWWKNDDENERGDALVAHIDALEDQASELYFRDRVHEQIYDNATYDHGKYASALRLLAASGFSSARLNVTRSIVQTIVSKLGVKRPAIKVNADDVDYSYKQRARRLTRIIGGVNHMTDMSRINPMVIRDACIIGTGATYTGEEHGKVITERVPREELFVDPREVRYGQPRSIYRRQVVDRSVLCAMYPDAEEQIEMAPEAQPWPDEPELADLDGDVVSFYQGWHLPSGPKSDDGVYCGAVDIGGNGGGATVVTGPWDRARLPFAFQRYEKPRKGFWGRGVVEDLAGLQWKLDEGLTDIQTALYWGSQLRVWHRRGSPTPKEMLGRLRQPSVIPYDGMKPEYDAPNPVSADLVRFVEFIIQQMFDITGVSMMAAQAKNPLGAGASAVALQEFYDIQSERYSQLELMVSDWWVDTDELVIDTHKEIAQGTKSHTVKWCDRKVIHQVQWDKVDLDNDAYRLVLEPTNFLPDTRAGKLEATERLAQIGIMQGTELSAVLGGFPDLERANRLRNAPYEYLEMVMEQLADEEVDFAMLVPDPTMDIPTGITMCKNELNRARTEDAPEEVLQRYRDWLLLAEELVNKAAKGSQDQQAIANAAQQPPMPPGAGAIPPQSSPTPVPEGAPMLEGAMPPMPPEVPV